MPEPNPFDMFFFYIKTMLWLKQIILLGIGIINSNSNSTAVK
jgi:hypothetical protein